MSYFGSRMQVSKQIVGFYTYKQHMKAKCPQGNPEKEFYKLLFKEGNILEVNLTSNVINAV